MKVHNLMEEYVTTRVNLLYDQLNENRPSWLTCDCEDCRLDAVSYVLNRIPPRYVVSGRGIAHSNEVFEDTQIRADVDALSLEGIRLINTIQRPYHKNARKFGEKDTLQPSFNFPVFIGTVYDGSSFEPMYDAKVTLKYDDLVIDMIDKTWSNPCSTYKSTKGTYSFWVKPFLADKPDMSKRFHFTVEVSAAGYTPISYGFDIPVVSEADRRLEMNSSFSLKIQDLFLFRTEVDNPMED